MGLGRGSLEIVVSFARFEVSHSHLIAQDTGLRRFQISRDWILDDLETSDSYIVTVLRVGSPTSSCLRCGTSGTDARGRT